MGSGVYCDAGRVADLMAFYVCLFNVKKSMDMSADVQTVIMWVILLAAVVATVYYVLKRVRGGGKNSCDCGCCSGCPAKRECGDEKKRS